MNKRNKQNKGKGFTLVELVIVIAIIAILAAVLIPTFSSMIDKAHRSADQHLVRSINTILSTEAILGTEITSVEQLKEVLAANGIRSLDLSCGDHALYWVKDANCVVLCDTKEDLVVMPEEFVGPIPEDKINSGEWVLITGDISSGGGNEGGDNELNKPEIDTSDMADHVIEEADRVISRVNDREYGGNTLTFIAASDMHEMSTEDHADATVRDHNSTSNKHAGQAASYIADRLDPDFLALLGDFTWGGDKTTIEGGSEAIKKALGYYSVAMENVDQTFLTTGEHDPLYSSFDTNNGEYLNYDELKALYGITGTTYRYTDVSDKKVRVILLDTADMEGYTLADSAGIDRIGDTQLRWFAETLNGTPSDHGIIILSHHPLDWNTSIQQAANMMQAYMTKGTYGSYDFRNATPAKVIAQFHGHVHGYGVDYIQHTLNGTGQLTTVPRLAIPNASYTRNNEYGGAYKDDNGDYSDISKFGEAPTYSSEKPTGDAQETAFCVITIDLDNMTIYAYSYGFGGGAYDRVVHYGRVDSHSISTDGLSNVNIHNDAISITKYTTYTAKLTAASGYTLDAVEIRMGGQDITSIAYNSTTGTIYIHHVTGDVVITATAEPSFVPTITYHFDADKISISNKPTTVENGSQYRTALSGVSAVAAGYSLGNVTVIMGGNDITSTAYSNGQINIANVTGHVVITVTAVEKYVNLVPTSIGVDGQIFNGVGYMDGAYVSGAHYNVDPDYVTTGFIWLPQNVTAIYMKSPNAEWADNESHSRMYFYTEEHLGDKNYQNTITGSGTGSDKFEDCFTVEELDDGYYKWTIKNSDLKGMYYWISLKGTGESLIITHDEPIE